MKGKDFSLFALNDISGGLNIKKSANEIDNKQGIMCNNFNFEGNKLITSKGMIKIYSLSGGKVQGIKKFGNDLYHISDGDIYRNGVKINTTGKLNYTGIVNFDIYENYILFADNTGINKPTYLLNGVVTEITSTALYNSISGLYAKYVIIYGSKSIWGGQYKDTIVFSKSANATTPNLIIDFTGYNSGVQSVGGQMSGGITGFELGQNGLYVFKEDEVLYTNSEKDITTPLPLFAFIFNKISSTGAINQQAIVTVKQEIFYYDGINKALRRLGYEQNLTTLKDTAISEDIEDILNGLPSNQLLATLSYSYPNIKLFLKSENSSANDVCISYNVDNKSFSTEDNKICYVANKGYLGSPYFNQIFQDEYTYSLDNLPKEGLYISKEYDLGNGVKYKRYGELEVMGKISNNITLYIDVYVDGNFVTTREFSYNDLLTSTIGTETVGVGLIGGNGSVKENKKGFRKKIDLYNDGQYIQFYIRYKGTGYAEISNIHFRYKPLKSFYNY